MPTPFSKRTAWDTAETPLAVALRRHQASGRPLLDLTASNPTRCGFHYDAAALLAPLSASAALDYDPNPRGMLSARDAVCAYYASHSAQIDPQDVFLATSTSEAYSFLFRLLCNAGDEVLIAQPSYPLFDFLADLDDVRLVPYTLVYDHGWQIDLESIRHAITPRTRAIALVNPNNPTGHYTKPWEREALESLCREHGLALIVDEVFLDHPFAAAEPFSFSQGEASVLTFVLSGLSKVAGLPQMKAAWIVCRGPEEEKRRAEDRLEIIADTFLSMNAPIQCALAHWLAGRQGIQDQIRERVRQNVAVLESMPADHPVTHLRIEGGWYAILRIPALQRDENTAIQLLTKDVSVHPGYFFGLPESGWLVVSLISNLADFSTGFQQIRNLLTE